MAEPNTEFNVGIDDRAMGYEGLCRYLKSDSDFAVFRRFSELNIRNILYLQDALCDASERLAELDKKPVEKGTRRFEELGERAELMSTVEDLLRKYNQAITGYAGVLKFPPASERQIKLVSKLLETLNPLVEEEQRYIQETDDLIALCGAEPDFITRSLLKGEHSLGRIFRDTTRTRSSECEGITFYSSNAVHRTARGICVLFCVVLLLAPLVLLVLYRGTPKYRMAIIASFLVTFAMLLATATNARNWEVVAGTAAYAAVLVAV